MSKLLKFVIAPAFLVGGMMFAAPSDAKAQGFSIRLGGYGVSHSQRHTTRSLYHGLPSYGSYFGTSRFGCYGNYGHWDYHPGHLDWHYDHWDYHPGHFDWHDTHHGHHGHRLPRRW